MAEATALESTLFQNIPVILPPSYFDDKVGGQIKQMASDFFQAGQVRLIIDFQHCKIVNSRGMSAMLDLAMKCSDDFQGKIVAINADQTKKNLFDLIGLGTLIRFADTLEEAAKLLLEP